MKVKITNVIMSKLIQIEINIIVGSLLGDGRLALYGRSKNAWYGEHGRERQKQYHQRKAATLERLSFKFIPNDAHGGVHSPSLPVLTELYNIFYLNKVKSIPPLILGF